LQLQWNLTTGLEIRIHNYADWVIYNELFVSGEYGRMVAMAFDRAAASGRTPHVVDLGANSGFFTLRILHEARLRGTAVTVTAIEPLPGQAERFQARVVPQLNANEHVRFVHGLAGERSGAGVIYENPSHLASSTLIATRNDRSRAVRVPYVDLSDIRSGEPFIDLLKCDIEGSEERVIENYADVFGKAGTAVFEFHRDLCDVARCQELLRSYGFRHAETFREGLNFTYGVWR